ncbi:MAG: hypothetical protein H6735_22435 [Alphaproteobacteria bacterium]|nr:hypothetical protein [Alphaproteobacteria bacterium]
MDAPRDQERRRLELGPDLPTRVLFEADGSSPLPGLLALAAALVALPLSRRPCTG